MCTFTTDGFADFDFDKVLTPDERKELESRHEYCNNYEDLYYFATNEDGKRERWVAYRVHSVSVYFVPDINLYGEPTFECIPDRRF